ncbi:MAG: hypothetical protein IKJ07_08385 [Clostridia bacterium]|nr:hypothetical protein [Clostridia bacterium]
MKRLIAVLLALVMVFAAVATLAACDNKKGGDETTATPEGTTVPEGTTDGEGTTDETVVDEDEKLEFIAPARPADAVLPTAKLGDYTYNSYAISLGSNWNPHAWETNGDQSILSYLTSPFVTMEALDTEEGLYQWVGEMATAIKDVTAQKQDLLTKYNVTLPEGKTAEEVESGYVFEFTLNPNAKWEDGTVINADSYVYSMQQLLNPDMKNYRANLYISGESAIAGGFNYYYSKDEGFYNGYTTKYASLADAMAAEDVYINVWDFWGAKGYTDAEGNACPQWVSVKDETVYGESVGDAFSGAALLQGYGAYLEVGGGYEAYAGIYVVNENVGATWDGVGLVKTGDYSFLYVCDTAIDFNYFLTSCTDTWLVHEGLYEAGKKEVGGLIVTDYMTSLATSISYGTYKMTVFEDNKQVVYVQNENWYGFEKTSDGKLVSYTQFTVDDKYLQQYITTKIVIDVMTEDVAKQKFLKGELMAYSPTAAELNEYKLSERLQVVDETYTMSFFFHTNLDNLKALDASGKNAYSVVLNNYNFRKAMSFAIDRADFVTATQAWTPAYSLMNHLYHYDIYNDPASSYRKSEEAMQAIVNLYGVEYGEGKLYETLEDAYDSITGYNLTEAKALMTKACDELVAAGLYTKGSAIKIQIGWAKGSLTEDDTKQCELIQKYLNAAVEGSGFGTITLEPLGNINDRYGDTAAGLYAIGYGAWGGAAFYPFRNFQVYTDPTQYDINEAGCWDPTTETLTLTVEGEEVTMTWQAWGNSMIGTGAYANADNKVKLAITAQMEEAFLAKFYRIPLAVTTVCTLSSYKVEDYTDEYNIMYGFGGFRIMDYNYNDAEWAAYVAEQGGELNYK